MEEERDSETMAQEAVENADVLKTYVEGLEGKSRRSRQQAAHVLGLVAQKDASLLAPNCNDLVDALNRPEAQTRWEILDILTELIPTESRSCEKAILGAETALFDEDSGQVRLAAMKFLCALGATTENRSEKVWSLIDEGIQCYHGDLEFQDMLVAVTDFSAGKLAPSVKEALAARMKFDAESGKGGLKKKAQQIVDNVS